MMEALLICLLATQVTGNTFSVRPAQLVLQHSGERPLLQLRQGEIHLIGATGASGPQFANPQQGAGGLLGGLVGSLSRSSGSLSTPFGSVPQPLTSFKVDLSGSQGFVTSQGGLGGSFQSGQAGSQDSNNFDFASNGSNQGEGRLEVGTLIKGASGSVQGFDSAQQSSSSPAQGESGSFLDQSNPSSGFGSVQQLKGSEQGSSGNPQGSLGVGNARGETKGSDNLSLTGSPQQVSSISGSIVQSSGSVALTSGSQGVSEVVGGPNDSTLGGRGSLSSSVSSQEFNTAAGSPQIGSLENINSSPGVDIESQQFSGGLIKSFSGSPVQTGSPQGSRGSQSSSEPLKFGVSNSSPQGSSSASKGNSGSSSGVSGSLKSSSIDSIGSSGSPFQSSGPTQNLKSSIAVSGEAGKGSASSEPSSSSQTFGGSGSGDSGISGPKSGSPQSGSGSSGFSKGPLGSGRDPIGSTSGGSLKVSDGTKLSGLSGSSLGLGGSLSSGPSQDFASPSGSSQGLRGSGLSGSSQGLSGSGLSGSSQGLRGSGLSGSSQGLSGSGLSGSSQGLSGSGLSGSSQGLRGSGLSASSQGLSGSGLSGSSPGLRGSGLSGSSQGLRGSGLSGSSQGLRGSGLSGSSQGSPGSEREQGIGGGGSRRDGADAGSFQLSIPQATLFRDQFENRKNEAQRSGVQGKQTPGNAKGSSAQLFRFAPVPTPENIDEVKGVFEPLNLPSGSTLLLGQISSAFSCIDLPYGYYADQDNSCRIFHICYPAIFINGRIETYQYSFMCGEKTVFDQKEMTCVNEAEALPCNRTPEYFFRNSEFGLPGERPQF